MLSSFSSNINLDLRFPIAEVTKKTQLDEHLLHPLIAGRYVRTIEQIGRKRIKGKTYRHDKLLKMILTEER